MSTDAQGFQSFFRFLASFCIGQIASSSIRAKVGCDIPVSYHGIGVSPTVQ